ncbi:family 16 putative glycoside hydrolase [Cercophora samala]|uniref:endo-1,3(4)-beta-glucanase n=1 Tax=Cercophora samala TaxID=330535 RepID=A0AA40DBX6_9PEZI|nr:family 16 putative glycoside hydrolase [Cercophora samala]
MVKPTLFSQGALLASLAQAATAASSSKYTLTQVFNATNFFSEFTFFNEPDPTHGFVEYVDAPTANRLSLAGYSQNGVYLGVDYTNTTTTGRKSTRVTSNQSFTKGLFIADIAHMPASASSSCGLWPAYWMFGPDWPNSGEIDILEGVNTQKSNSITLHTAKGCEMANTGSLGSTKLSNGNCEGNTGCGQTTSATNNYGSGFNDIGGGIYALEWTDDHIAVWFFPRTSNTCKSLVSASPSSVPNTNNFGTPLAKFVGNEAGNCSIPSHFKDHNIVFDTTFCGDWAGQVWGQDDTCKSLADTCEDWVGQNPKGFQEAYWLVNDIKVYQQVEQGPAAGQTNGGLGVQRKPDEERRRARSFEA